MVWNLTFLPCGLVWNMTITRQSTFDWQIMVCIWQEWNIFNKFIKQNYELCFWQIYVGYGRHAHHWTQANNWTFIHFILFCWFFFLMFFMIMGGSSGDFYYFFDFQRQLNDQEKNMKKMSMSKQQNVSKQCIRFHIFLEFFLFSTKLYLRMLSFKHLPCQTKHLFY
jgi:hypothetical protein